MQTGDAIQIFSKFNNSKTKSFISCAKMLILFQHAVLSQIEIFSHMEIHAYFFFVIASLCLTGDQFQKLYQLLKTQCTTDSFDSDSAKSICFDGILIQPNQLDSMGLGTTESSRDPAEFMLFSTRFHSAHFLFYVFTNISRENQIIFFQKYQLCIL